MHRPARGVLVADGLGCAAAAALLIARPDALTPVDPTGRTHRMIVGALSATSAICLAGVREPRPCHLGQAAAVNAGWVAICLAAAPSRPTRLGRRLVLATAVLDAAAGLLQWRLRSTLPNGARV